MLKNNYEKKEKTDEEETTYGFLKQMISIYGYDSVCNEISVNNEKHKSKNKELAFSKMLPTETKRVNMFKDFYGSYLNSIINEYERIRILNAKRHKENITVFIRKLSDCLTDFHVSLADRLTEFNEMRDDEIYCPQPQIPTPEGMQTGEDQ